MTDFSWYKEYPQGIPHTINPDRYNSVLAFYEDCIKRYKDLPAYENMGKCMSFNELDVLSTRFATYLQNKTNLKKGDRIAIQLPNLLQFPVAFFGAVKAGLVVVNTNPLYTEREMEHQFKDSGAKAIVILSNFADKLQEIIKHTEIKTVIITDIGDLLGGLKGAITNFVVKYIKKMVPSYSINGSIKFNDVLKGGESGKYSRPTLDRNDVCFLQYTGGTTGVSKGAMLTHRNILANMEQIYEWFKPCLKERQEIVITPLPLYHIFALTANCMAMLNYGAKNILITNPKDLNAFVKEMSKHKFTVITGVNTLFNALLNNEEFAKLDFSSLKISVGGGMAVQQPVAEKWHNTTGTQLVEGYGLTETSPVVSCNIVVGGVNLGTVGLPLPSTEMKLMDDDGVEVSMGEPGEIWVKGPQVMAGYWKNQDETNKTMSGEWLKTGDIGTVDEKGYFRVVDRKKEMICVSGFNVYPNEVEEVIAHHPKVKEVGVKGVKDERTTEAVKAFIVKKDPSLTEEEIIAHCREFLTSYKVPKQIAFREELPKSNVGKILRRLLE